VIAAVVAVLVLGGGGLTWALVAQQDDGAGERSTVEAGPTSGPVEDPPAEAPSTAPPSTAEVTSAAPTASPEEQALRALISLREQSLRGLVLDGRWVAQVASKSVGITDPLQVAQNGSHTFYAVDILAESNGIRDLVPSSPVLLVQSTDFGRYSVAPDGQPFWVTLVDAGFTSSEDVDAWCATTFSYMTAQELENACAPRTLTPSYR
jgi:hypothetical protein